MQRTSRAIAGIALIGVGVAIATGWWWPSTAEATDEVREPVGVVEIDDDSGDVSVRADDVSTTTVRQRFRYSFGTPDDGFSLEDGTLRLADCGWQCSVDYDVVVPRGTTVHGKLDSGDLTLDGVAGVQVHADSGTITMRNVDGTVKVEADSGDVRGHGLRGPVEAHADSGDVVLHLAAPDSVTADADSGDVELTVPSASYRVTGSTDSGERTITVPTDPGSPFVLDLSSDSGDVTVRTS